MMDLMNGKIYSRLPSFNTDREHQPALWRCGAGWAWLSLSPAVTALLEPFLYVPQLMTVESMMTRQHILAPMQRSSLQLS